MNIDVNETVGLTLVAAAVLGAAVYDRFLYHQVKKIVNTSTNEDPATEIGLKNTYEYLVASQAVAKIVKAQMESIGNVFATAEEVPLPRGEGEPPVESDGVYL